MALQEIYNRYLDQYSNIDPDWVQFVHDHQRLIKRRAVPIEINIFKSNELQYRLTEFLKENNYPLSISWIVALINQLPSEYNFVGLTHLYVPDMSHLARLRETFNTVMSNQKSIRKK